MSTTLRIINKPEKLNAACVRPGDMWRDPDHDTDRESWYVCLAHSPLPHPVLWYTTQPATDSDETWTVTGEPPNLTVMPSINAEPYWHGFITDGVLTP